ncbi:N-methyl-L-tryptophan oxidase [Pseudomonas sp. GX19020]|uniref:N-methyl-L-tryptophan oxidase n=1 Tax=Pseudomonas sp. GX19020 TaxID=2942277 RepID=UPI00201A1F14|nr:N-methyl-L-tryptophan oxidase [Pseudomonas sp. GX19020]MCL4068085.1 N-methyl-L-tryptophan oxidase [Pseudomonas sp. GX19020]
MTSQVAAIEIDVVVIGLGAMGAASLYQLAKRGERVIGIDRFAPPHNKGSSHGGTRVTREAVGEGPAYVPMAVRSHQILTDLEKEFGRKFLVKSGTLVIGSPMNGATPLHGADDFLESSIAMAERFGIAHEVLNADQLRVRYPQFSTIRDTDRGYLEPNAGYMLPEALIEAQIAGARAAGAEVMTDTTVTALRQEGATVIVETSKGTLHAKRVVVAAGAWARELLGAPFTELLTVTRQTIHWFDADDFAPLAPDNMPVFIWFVTDKLEDYFTGFPVTDPAEGFKVVASRDTPDFDHNDMSPKAEMWESNEFYARHVAPNMPGVKPDVVQNATCIYTNTPDNGFIIDEHPAMDRVMVVSACSGHGFKHSMAIGECVAQVIHDGASKIDLSAFSLKRFLA